jgi:hypothetical protein
VLDLVLLKLDQLPTNTILVRGRQKPPIKIPAASTIEPPSTIWKTACMKGVLMNRARTYAIAQSSKKTTMPAMLVAIQKAFSHASGTR